MANINLSGSISTTGTSILGATSVVFATDANHTLSVAEYTNNFLAVTSGVALTATRNLIAPLVQGQSFVIQNNTTGGQSIQVIGSSGVGVTIGPGLTVSVVCDGTNYLPVSGSSGGNPIFITQTDWYLDGYAGNDANPGTISLPVKTVMGGIVAKWGTNSPILVQTVTIHVVSGQSVGVERAIIKPNFVGSNTNFVIVGTPANIGSTFVAGTVTAKVRGNPGNSLQIANMPVGAAQGVLVRNITRSSSAIIASMSGSTATMEQPLPNSYNTTITATPSVTPTIDDTWATGDTLQLQTLPILNLVAVLPTGGDSNSTDTTGVFWTQWIHVPDISGVTAGSDFTIDAIGPSLVFSQCYFDPFLVADATRTSFGVYLLGCHCFGGGFAKSISVTATFLVIGGALGLAAGFNHFSCDGGWFYGDVITTNMSVSQIVSLRGIQILTQLNNRGPATLSLDSTTAMSAWGGILQVRPNGNVINASGLAWTSAMSVTPDFLSTSNSLVTVASSFVPNTGTWSSNIPLTMANLVTWGTLLDGSDGNAAGFIFGPGTPAVPPSWIQTDWYLDGYAGNDLNSGAIGSPVKTITGGIVPRWGTTSPVLPQTTTIHVVNGQAANLERANIRPVMAGASNFVIVGTPSNVGSTFAAGTVTPKTQGAPGSDLQIANMPVGAAAGVLVRNQTKSSSAFIVSMSGSTATFAEPFKDTTLTTVSGSFSPVTDDTWATGDTLQMQSLPTLNLETWLPVGGDVSVSVNAVSWFQFIHIPDASGTSASSTFPITPTGISTIFSACWLDPYTVVDASAAGFIPTFMGCYCPGSGTSTGTTQFWGGYISGGFQYSAFNQTIFQFDCILANGAFFYSNSIIDSCHVSGLLGVWAGASLSIEGSTSKVWGNYTLQVFPGGIVNNATSQTWSSRLLTTGQLQFQGAGSDTTHGWAEAANGITYGPFILTPANLDLVQGIMKCGTGARFVGGNVGSLPSVPVTWSTTDWYVDPVAGVDTNPGTFSSPVKTIMGGIVPRWGTQSPILPQTTNIHLVNPETLGQERILLSPQLTGTNTNFVIVGSPANIGSTFAAGTVTPKAQGNPGNDLQIANLPVGAVAGVLVHNITKDGYAIIDSMSGTTGTLCQPFTTAFLTTPSALDIPNQGTTWATGDTLQLLTLPLLNLETMEAIGGDSNSAASNGVLWTQMVHIPDISGTVGSSSFTTRGRGANVVFSACVVDPFVESIFGGTYFGSQLNGGALFTEDTEMTGGATHIVLVTQGNWFINNDTIVHDTALIQADVWSCNGMHLASGASLAVFNGAAINLGGTNAIWGAGTINNSGTVQRNSGNSWASVLPVATLTLDLYATGSAVALNGITYGPFLITPANLDTYSGLRNPASNSCYTNGANGAAPAHPVTWSQSAWYWDPANSTGLASDNNSGADNTHPLSTWAGFISKMGTDRPALPYAQAITINKLSAQSANTDPVYFSPLMTGGAQCNLVDTPTVFHTAFTGGTVTAKVRGAPGTLLQVASMPAGTVAKQLVFNQTRNSYAFIDSMSGTTATMQQPVPASKITSPGTGFAEDNTWATGDTLIIYQCTLLNLKEWFPRGGDVTAGLIPSGGSIQFAQIAAPSGSGFDALSIRSDGASNNAIAACQVNGRLHLDTSAGTNAFGAQSIACTVANQVSMGGPVTFYAGGCTGLVADGSQMNGGINGDSIVHGTISVYGGLVTFAFMYSDGSITLTSAKLNGFALWGSYSLTLTGPSQYFNQSGSTFASSLQTTGAIHIGANTTGYAVAGNYTYGPFLLTAANMDTYNGLQDPESSAGFVNPNITAGIVTPVTWTQSAWFIDPANSSGLASDNNSGLTNTTPLLTFAGMTSKLGTDRPRWQNVSPNLTFMSSHTNNNDPVVINWYATGANNAIIQATAGTVVVSGTLSSVTPKSRAAGSNTSLIATLPAGAAVNQLVVNTTRGNSRAWIKKSLGSNSFELSQPFSPQTIPTTTAPTYVDTWANTDSIQCITPLQVNLVKASYFSSTLDAGFDNNLYIYNLTVFDPVSISNDWIYVSPSVTGIECVFQRALTVPTMEFQGTAFFSNCGFAGGISWQASTINLVGGYLASFGAFIGGQGTIDGDFAIETSTEFRGGGTWFIGLMYMGANTTFRSVYIDFSSQYYATHVVYGRTGALMVLLGNAYAYMSTGTFTAGWTAPSLVAGVTMNNGTTANSVITGSPDVLNGGITTSVANLDATAGASGFGGKAFVFGGATVTNVA